MTQPTQAQIEAASIAIADLYNIRLRDCTVSVAYELARGQAIEWAKAALTAAAQVGEPEIAPCDDAEFGMNHNYIDNAAQVGEPMLTTELEESKDVSPQGYAKVLRTLAGQLGVMNDYYLPLVTVAKMLETADTAAAQVGEPKIEVVQEQINKAYRLGMSFMKERCAKVADEHWNQNEGTERKAPGWDSACLLIAAAIRKLKDAP